MKYGRIDGMRSQSLILLGLIVFITFTASVAMADLIAYWPLDEGSGNTAADVL